jgi:hypothetical protein
MQWSLKSLLVATAIIPLAVFAIAKSTPFYVSAVVTVAAVVWIAIAILAWVETGQRQAWARGMLVAATGYAILIYALGSEIGLSGSRLATSHLLGYAYQAAFPQQLQQLQLVAPTQVLTTTVMDPNGRFVVTQPPNSVVQLSPQVTFNGNVMTLPYPLAVGTASPQPQDFCTIGHVYWGVLLALVGGWFAAWIARRQKQEAEKPQSAT